MSLRESFERQGNWLFRYRSYLPLFLLILAVAGVIRTHHPVGGSSLAWDMVCLGISLFGQVIRIMTIGYVPPSTSGRNVLQQVASTLNTTGIYSVVRHPLYVGNFFMWLGVGMFTRSWWVCIVFFLIFWLYYERIMVAEEAFLQRKFGEVFTEWASHTPAVLPAIWKWQHSDRLFNIRKVLRQEYGGLAGLILIFTILDIVASSLTSGKLTISPTWLTIAGIGLLFYVVIRILKKATRFLKEFQKC